MTEVEKEQVKMTSSSPTERPNPKLVRGRRKKTGTLDKFKAGECNILPCTDVASRGLDIPSVDTVINYDIPTNSKDYIHQVGRTARAGRSGVAISLVNRYELEWYIQTEKLIGKKLRQFPAQEEEVLLLLEHVTEAKRISQMVWKVILEKGIVAIR